MNTFKSICEIALYKLKIDSQYLNSFYFDSEMEQIDFFNFENNKLPNAYNVDFGNLLYTEIIIKNSNYVNIYEFNYLVVKNIVNEQIQYFYYFVENIEYIAERQFKFYLKLDILQSYFIKNITLFKETHAYILRSHLNRFIKNADATYTYNYKNVEDNYLLNNEFETANNPKFLKKIYPVQVISKKMQVEQGVDINKFTAGYWIYCFLDTKFDYPNTLNIPVAFQNQSLPFKIFCFYGGTQIENIRNNSGTIIINGREFNALALINFLNGQDENGQDFTGRLKGVKISAVPPYMLGNGNTQKIINANNNIIEFDNINFLNCDIIQNCRGQNFFSLTRVDNIGYFSENGVPNVKSEILTKTGATNLEDLLQTKFTKDDIINNSNNYNPQLLGQNFTDIRVKQPYLGIDGAVFNPQLIGDLSAVSFNYAESIQPEQSNIFISYASNAEDNLYLQENSQTITQFTFIADMSYTYNIDAYSEFLAQNKNFVIGRSVAFGTDLFAGALNIATSAAQIPVDPLNGGVMTAQSIFNFGKIFINETQKNLQLKNLKASNSTIQRGGNITINLALNANFLNVEIWQVAESKYREYNDYLNVWGNAVNARGKIGDFINTRKEFNFFQANLLVNSINLPNFVFEELQKILNTGTRFWNNTENIGDFSLQNYEKYFDAES